MSGFQTRVGKAGNLSQAIFNKSKAVSEAVGLRQPEQQVLRPSIGDPLDKAGAYRYLEQEEAKTRPEAHVPAVDPNMRVGAVSVQSPVEAVRTSQYSYNPDKSFDEMLRGNLAMLHITKEYHSALISLFNLYAMDKLTDSVLTGMEYDDLMEIKGILREFTALLDDY